MTNHVLPEVCEEKQFLERKSYTPLMHAACVGDMEVGEILLSNGAFVNQSDKFNGIHPLHLAVKNTHLDLMKRLIAEGADVNALSLSQGTPLHFAARHSLRSVLEKSNSLEEETIAKNAEADAKVLDIVNLLLRNGCDINLNSEGGSSALHIATTKRNSSLVKLLLENGANVNSVLENDETESTTLLCVIKSSHDRFYERDTLNEIQLEMARMLLEYGLNVNQKGTSDESPLVQCCKNW